MEKYSTLRKATLEDVPDIVDIARELAKGGPYEAIGIDYTKARQMVEKFIIEGQVEYLALISHDAGRAVGAIFAYAFQPLFSHNKIAVEVLFYLKEDYRNSHRGKEMMEAFEYWAKLIGCGHVQYGVLSNSPEGMDKFYTRNGAVLSEQIWMKEL